MMNLLWVMAKNLEVLNASQVQRIVSKILPHMVDKLKTNRKKRYTTTHDLKLTANLLWSCKILEIKDPKFASEAISITKLNQDKLNLEQIHSVVCYLIDVDTPENIDLMYQL